jgi:hypothetical protein
MIPVVLAAYAGIDGLIVPITTEDVKTPESTTNRLKDSKFDVYLLSLPNIF